MSWRDNLRDASFNGIPFKENGDEFSGGWNIDENNIPIQESVSDGATSAAEEEINSQLRPEARARDSETRPTAKKAKRFAVSMFFLGDNYIAERDAMLAAFDAGGLGVLVTQTRGSIRCFVEEYTSTMSKDEGGYETIDAVFISAPNEQQVTTSIDTQQSLNNGILDALGSIGGGFGYEVAGVADYVFDEASEIAETLSGSVFDLIGLGGTNNTVNDFILRIREFQRDIDTIVRTPERYYEEISGLVLGLTGIFEEPSAGYEAQEKLYSNFGDDLKPVNQTTPNRVIQANNQDSVVFTVKALAACQMAGNGSQIDFISVDQADLIKETTSDALDDIAEEVGDSDQSQEIYEAIVDVKDKFLTDVEQSSESLPSNREITTNQNEPSLVIAYDLYANLESAP